MEKFSYNNNSYPDSTDSSPRSREIDFDNNPPPWDNNEQTYKVKFMCSYGGKIQPRPHDNQLTYVNGETKILSVDRNVRFSTLSTKLSNVCGDVDVSFKYQLPGEDLDALISVTNDDDLEHMMHEYDRLLRVSSKPARLRLFLFPITGFGSQGSTQSDRDRFVEALNTVPEKPATVTNPVKNVDFLFGSEKIAPQPVQEAKLPVPVKVTEPDPIEFQRMQIREPPVPQTVTQAPPPLMNYWQGNNNNNNSGPVFTTGLGVPEQQVFPTGLGVPEQQVFPTSLGVPEKPVYMIPSTGGVYQPQLQTQGVIRPVQGNQGGYYPTQGPVQRMVSDTYREQGAYTMAQQQLTKLQQQLQYSGVPPPQYSAVPPPQHSGVPLPQYSAVPPPQQGVGILPETTAYMPQVNYGGGMGKQVYYTEAPAPQYHGIGLPVTGLSELRTGPDGKIVGMSNIITSKVSSQNLDSAV